MMEIPYHISLVENALEDEGIRSLFDTQSSPTYHDYWYC